MHFFGACRFLTEFGSTIMARSPFQLEAISKKGFWLKFKAGPNFNPQVPAGNALGVHTQVFRGVEARDQHRNLAKKLF